MTQPQPEPATPHIARSASASASASPEGSQRWRTIGIAAGLFLVTLLVYLPALSATIDNFDDGEYITENRLLRSLHGLAVIWTVPQASPQYYPLTFTSFWIEHHLWGDHPMGYHLVNVLLHASSAILLWRLLLRLGVPGALFAAAIFAPSPGLRGVCRLGRSTQEYAVDVPGIVVDHMLLTIRRNRRLARRQTAFVEQSSVFRADCGVLRSRDARQDGRDWAAGGAPGDRLVEGGRISARDVAPLLPLFAVGIGMGVGTSYIESQFTGMGDDLLKFSLVGKCLIAGRAAWFYAGKLAWPYPLMHFYPRWSIHTSAAWQYSFPLAAFAVVAALWLLRGGLVGDRWPQ